MSEIEYYIEKIKEWGYSKNLMEKSNATKQGIKTLEELTELLQAIQDKNSIEIRDGIGDCFVTLILQAELQGLSIEECLSYVYDQIKDRTGKTINGVFYKNQ